MSCNHIEGRTDASVKATQQAMMTEVWMWDRILLRRDTVFRATLLEQTVQLQPDALSDNTLRGHKSS